MRKDQAKKPRRVHAVAEKSIGKAVSKFFGTKRPEFVTRPVEGRTLPTGYLSITQVGMYQRCPLQYMHRYLEGRKEPPGIVMTEGILHHNVVSVHNKKVINGQKGLSAKRAIMMFNDALSAVRPCIMDWQGVNEKTIRDRGKMLLKNYLDWEIENLRPREIEAAEEAFVIPFDGKGWQFDLVGVMDVRTSKDIIDYKVVGRLKSKNDAANDLQLGAYSMAGERAKVAFVCLVKPSGRIVEVPTKCTHRRHKWTRRIVSDVAQAISAGNFPPCDPGSWICSPRWCGFYDTHCRGKR